MDTITNDDGLKYELTVEADERMALNFHTIDADNTNDAFLRSAKNIISAGYQVSPRGMPTREISPMMLRINNPKDCIISLQMRKLPYKFMAMELLWILSGDPEPWIMDYLPRLDQFTDIVDGNKRLMGAYGPRLRNFNGVDQFKYVVDKLKQDKDSRQALSIIWNPTIDTKGYKDTPCTSLFKFSIRNNKLNMTTFMRSNDLFLGSCIDWFNFCTIQCILADVIGVQVGAYYHVADSLHIYERDIPAIEKIIADSHSYDNGIPTVDAGTGYTSLEQVYEDVTYARNLKATQKTPDNDRYLSRLMRWVSMKK